MKLTIGVVSSKGGVGKTTIAAHLAVAAQTGSLGFPSELRVLGVDCDEQRSLTKIFELRGDMQAEGFDYPEVEVRSLLAQGRKTVTFESNLRKWAADSDIVIVDVPGVKSPALAATLKVVDVALIPVDASMMGEYGLVNVLEVYAAVQETFNPSLVGVLVPNNIRPRTTAGRLFLENLADLDEDFEELAIFYDPKSPVTFENRTVFAIRPEPAEGRLSRKEFSERRQRMRPGATALEKPGASGLVGAQRDLRHLIQLLVGISEQLEEG